MTFDSINDTNREDVQEFIWKISAGADPNSTLSLTSETLIKGGKINNR